MLVAAAATAFSSCNKEASIEENKCELRTISISSVKPSLEGDTKTEWNGSTIQWSKGDAIRMAYTADGVWQNADGTSTSTSGDAKLYASNPLTEGGATAIFKIASYFKGSASGEYRFYGLYPSKATLSADFSTAPLTIIKVPSEQKPAPSSFDPNADIMTGMAVNTYTQLPSEIPMNWTRQVAHADITLKSLQASDGEILKKIVITANAGAELVGNFMLDIATGEIVKDDSNTKPNVISVLCDNLTIESNKNINLWLSFLPATLTSLEVYVETNLAKYTKSFTGISKEFKKNARNTLGINMADATKEEIPQASGKYLWTLANGELNSRSIIPNGKTVTFGDTDKLSWVVNYEKLLTDDYFGWDTNKGCQIGSSKKPCKSYSLTTSGLADKTISKIIVNSSTASKGTAKLSISVGGNSTSLKDQVLTATPKEYTAADINKSGDIVISWSNDAHKGFYLKSIEIQYN